MTIRGGIVEIARREEDGGLSQCLEEPDVTGGNQSKRKPRCGKNSSYLEF